MAGGAVTGKWSWVLKSSLLVAVACLRVLSEGDTLDCPVLSAFHRLDISATPCTGSACKSVLPRRSTPCNGEDRLSGMCPANSEFFLGACACHAHYTGDRCERKQDIGDGMAPRLGSGWGPLPGCLNREWENTVPVSTELEDMWWFEWSPRHGCIDFSL